MHRPYTDVFIIRPSCALRRSLICLNLSNNDAITCILGHTTFTFQHLQLCMSSNSTKSFRNSSLFDILKPQYHEAVYRLKNSLFALVALFTLTYLLPLPTPYASAWNFYRDSFRSSWEKSLAIAGAISLFKFALPPLLTQDHDGARSCRIIRLLSPPRQHSPSNHRDPFSTSTLSTSPITFQIPFAPFKRRPAATTPSHDDTTNVARQIRRPFS